MNKLEDFYEASKLHDLLRKNGMLKKEKKCCNPLLVVLSVLGVVLVIAAIAYGIYRYFTPDYLEDYEDDFDDDDFDDDFIEDEVVSSEKSETVESFEE